ncbi:c-type cytochrome biogenesis protein CcsB [Peptococcaceae bacterium 1198_IL3148]
MFYNWGLSLINLAFVGYLISGLFYLLVTWIKRDLFGKAAYWTAVLSFGFHTIAITLRAVAAGRLPFATMYEFVLLFSWGVVMIYLFVQARFKVPLLGMLVLPLALILLAYSSVLSQEIRPLMPALQSNWLQFHVLTAIISYGSFGVSFAVAIIYLLRDELAKVIHGMPTLAVLEKMLYRSIAFGFPLLTLVLITGAVWAEQVWGRWWSWDPKETWALITWIIYAVYLHARFAQGWRGKKAAWMAIVGFLAVLFTLFGVTIFMSGLHSYG